MNFMNAIKTEIDDQKTMTENGAVAYESSGKKLLDFYFAITAMRQESEHDIERKFSGVYYENPLVAIKTLFQIRDCRGGNGERRLFRICMKWLAENQTEVAEAVLALIPEYGRFDDWWGLLETNVRDDVLALTKKQLEEDQDNMEKGKSISLLPKWSPSLNSSSYKTRELAEIIRAYLGCSPRNYRKGLSKMRRYLNVVEQKMSAKEWSKIDYSTVPSQANLKYNNAFLRNDEERRRAYLESLKKGETKINAGTLQPHEIVGKYKDASGWYRFAVREYDETLEQLWKALPVKSVDNTLVVRDSSGSMTSGYSSKCCPLDVATALAIYTSEHNNGIWKDKYITFSENPRFIDLSNCKTLRDKLEFSFSESEVANTNIEKTMMLILNTAINNRCSQEDMPKNIVILSDLQFDAMTTIRGNRKALFDNLAEIYKQHGYLLPRIVFWNLSGQVNNTIPMQQNELGVALISGFSPQLLDMVMSGKTDPYEVLLEAINTPRYQPVEDAVKEIL